VHYDDDESKRRSMSSWASFSSSVQQKKKKDEAAQQSLFLVSKETGSNLGASSAFLGLKAELAQRKAAASSSKLTGSNSSSLLGREEKRKLPAHLRPSPNVLARSQRHDQRQTTSSWANTPSAQLDATRRALERKAAIYHKLKSGATGGLDEEAMQDSLIDWDRKAYQQQDANSYSSSEEDAEENANASLNEKNDATDSDEDPMTEYEDDLGRMRRVRRSRVPRSSLRDQQQKNEEEYDESLISYGPSTSFPVYQPDPAALHSRSQEGYKRKGTDHFDAQFEKRYRGAGFYQFSQDEETRRKQMEAIKEDRDETERIRQTRNVGAHDKIESLAEARRKERRLLVDKARGEIDKKRKRLLGEAL
jgi:hypothetical protein